VNARTLVEELVQDAEEKAFYLPGRFHVSNLRLGLAAQGRVHTKNKKETHAELRVNFLPVFQKLAVDPSVHDLLKGLKKEKWFVPIWSHVEATMNPPANKRSAWKLTGGQEASSRLLNSPKTLTELLKLVLSGATAYADEDWYQAIKHLAQGRRITT
jgi:hypothetical protein